MLNAYHFRELSLPLQKKGEVANALAHALNLREDEIFNLEVERFALDSRKRSAPHWSYNVRFETLKNLLESAGYTSYNKGSSHFQFRKAGCELITLPYKKPMKPFYVNGD